MTQRLAEQHFYSYEDAKKWAYSWIAPKDVSFLRREIYIPPERYEKVVASDGQYS